MKFNLDGFLTVFIGVFSTGSIEFLEWMQIQEILKFSGQTIIGILTIIYLYKKIKKLKV